MKEFAAQTDKIFEQLYKICKEEVNFRNWPRKRNTPDHIIYLLQSREHLPPTA